MSPVKIRDPFGNEPSIGNDGIPNGPAIRSPKAPDVAYFVGESSRVVRVVGVPILKIPVMNKVFVKQAISFPSFFFPEEKVGNNHLLLSNTVVPHKIVGSRSYLVFNKEGAPVDVIKVRLPNDGKIAKGNFVIPRKIKISNESGHVCRPSIPKRELEPKTIAGGD